MFMDLQMGKDSPEERKIAGLREYHRRKYAQRVSQSAPSSPMEKFKKTSSLKLQSLNVPSPILKRQKTAAQLGLFIPFTPDRQKRNRSPMRSHLLNPISYAREIVEKGIFIPFSVEWYCWQLIHSACIVAAVIVIPALCAGFLSMGFAMRYLLQICDGIFVIDIVVSLQTVFYNEKSEAQSSLSERFQFYVETGKMRIDLASLGLTISYPILSIAQKLVLHRNAITIIELLLCSKFSRLTRLFRLQCVYNVLTMIESRHLGTVSMATTLKLRLLNHLFSLFVTLHLAACGWFIVTLIDTDESSSGEGNSWVPPLDLRQNPDPMKRYMRAIYWAVATITGMGEGASAPGTWLQFAFTVSLYGFGLTLHATLISSIANHLNRGDQRMENFRKRTTQIREFLEEAAIPRQLQVRIMRCQQHLFNSETLHRDIAEPLNGLPKHLCDEVLTFLNRDIITKVPLFRKCAQGFVLRLVQKLKPQICLRGDYLIREGNPATCMYFIRHGKLEVLSKGMRMAYLKTGDFLGEIGLLSSSASRTASVRALTLCELYMLEKCDFDEVAGAFPEERRKLLKAAERRSESNKIVQESARLLNENILENVKNHADQDEESRHKTILKEFEKLVEKSSNEYREEAAKKLAKLKSKYGTVSFQLSPNSCHSHDEKALKTRKSIRSRLHNKDLFPQICTPSPPTKAKEHVRRDEKMFFSLSDEETLSKQNQSDGRSKL